MTFSPDQSQTILLLDAEPKALRDQLAEGGVQVVVAHNCTEAIAFLNTTPIDLLLIGEIGNEDRQERERLRLHLATKKQSKQGCFPLLALVASEEEAHLETALTLGADDYLLRPPSTLSLSSRIGWLIRLRGRLYSKTTQLQGEAALQAEFKNIKSALLQTSFYDLSLLGNPLEEILKLALSIILSAPLLPKNPSGAIFLADRDETKLRLGCQLGISEKIESSCGEVLRGSCLCGQALIEKKVRFYSHVDDNHTLSYPGMAPHGHYIVPLLHEGGRVLGVLNIYLETGRSPSRELELFLSDIALILAMTISRKYFEKRLIASEVRFSSIANTSNDGIISINQENRITFANRRANQIFQYKEGELLGESIEKLIPKKYHLRHKAGLKKAATSQQLTLAGKIVELSGIRKNGEAFPMEISHSMWVSEGEPSFAAFIRDVTERKQTEEKMRLQSASMNSAANSIMISDIQGTIQWVNPAFEALTGYCLDEVVGKKVDILNSDYHPPDFFSSMWKTLQKGEIWQGQLRNRKKDGSLFWEEATITPILDQENTIQHFLSITEDVTNQKEIDETLWKAKVALEASHDQLAKVNELLLEERKIIENVVLKIQHSPLFDPTDLRILEKPMEKNSGDLICAAKKSNGARRVLLGDFAGHGLTAAIAGPLISEIFYAIGMDMPIEEMFRTLNVRLLQALNEDMYMTCGCLELNAQRDQVTLFNAGMVNILILRDGKIIHREPSRFVPRGLMDVPDQKKAPLPIQPGDRIILCTDGFEEATDPNGKMLGEERFCQLLETLIAQNRPLESLIQELEQFRQGGKQEDDMTLVELTC
ncbi:MAG: PAS domain S-box protein [Magnetococcales bacterium]|nr:PAS domain S-box protein [Magnetococcales bacterium]